MRDAQKLLCLIRLCLSNKFTYLMRLISPTALLPDHRPFHQHVDHLLRDTLHKFLRMPEIDAMPTLSWLQARLPVSLSGIGLINAEYTHPAAYISSVMECGPDIEKFLTASNQRDPLGITHVNILEKVQPLYQQLALRFPPLHISEGKVIKLPALNKIAQNSNGNQHDLSSAINTHIYHTTLTSTDTPLKALVRLHSCGREGKNLINAIPTHKEITFPPDGTLFVGAVSMYLGIPIYFAENALCPSCGKKHMNSDGYHVAATCLNESKRTIKHNHVRDTIEALGKMAGHTCKKENSSTLRKVKTGTRMRSDVSMDWFPKRALELDATITHPYTLLYGETSTKRARPTPEDAARVREASKDRQYRRLVEAADGEFHPVVVEAFGRFGPRGRAILNTLKDEAAFRTGIPRDIVGRYWDQRIVIAVYKMTLHDIKELSDEARRTRTPSRSQEEQARNEADVQDMGNFSSFVPRGNA